MLMSSSSRGVLEKDHFGVGLIMYSRWRLLCLEWASDFFTNLSRRLLNNLLSASVNEAGSWPAIKQQASWLDSRFWTTSRSWLIPEILRVAYALDFASQKQYQDAKSPCFRKRLSARAAGGIVWVPSSGFITAQASPAPLYSLLLERFRTLFNSTCLALANELGSMCVSSWGMVYASSAHKIGLCKWLCK